MAVQITLTATQHTGLTASPVGSVATWIVTFALEGTEMIRTLIAVPVKGPPSHQEAQQKHLNNYRSFSSKVARLQKTSKSEIRI